MKSVLLTAVVALALGGGVVMAAEKSEAAPSTQPTTEKKHAQKWTCPMKCEGSESDKPGKCPKCGMELQKAKWKGAKQGQKHGQEGAKNAEHAEKGGEQNQ